MMNVCAPEPPAITPLRVGLQWAFSATSSPSLIFPLDLLTDSLFPKIIAVKLAAMVLLVSGLLTKGVSGEGGAAEVFSEDRSHEVLRLRLWFEKERGDSCAFFVGPLKPLWLLLSWLATRVSACP